MLGRVVFVKNIFGNLLVSHPEDKNFEDLPAVLHTTNSFEN